MIPWELMRDLGQLSVLIVCWAIYVGSGITGIALAVAVVCWVIDFVRKEIGR